MTSFDKFNEIYLHDGGFFNFENFEYEEYRKLYEEWYNLMYNFINENNFISNGSSKEYISQNSTELFKEFKHKTSNLKIKVHNSIELDSNEFSFENYSFRITYSNGGFGYKLLGIDTSNYHIINPFKCQSNFFFQMDKFLTIDGYTNKSTTKKEIFKKFKIGDNEKILLKKLINIVFNFCQRWVDIEVSKIKSQKDKELKLKEEQNNLISKLDKDNNGIIDIIEDKNEFNHLLKKHQKVIIEKGKEFNENYTHQFIKVGNYIKQKRSNLQLIFDCIKQVQNQQDLDEYIEILENEIHSYNLLLINSLNLIVSLIEDDQITFYDIYEKFDKLNIYNSNWENEISQKLTTLNKGISELNSNIKGLMYEIRDMGDRIVNSIDDLSYVTEESTKMLDNRLGEIDSSIKTNNLLTLINTYQTYKINKNTKSLRG